MRGSPWVVSQRTGVFFALFSLYVIWGSTYLAMRFAVKALPPLLMAGARFLLAGVILMALVRWRGVALPTRKQWGSSAIVGVCFFFMGNGFVAIAMASERASSGLAAVACAMTPLWLALLRSVTGERLRSRECFGLVLGFVGVLILSAAGKRSYADVAPLALLLAGPLSWAVGSFLGRRLDLPASFMAPAAQMIAGGALMLVVGLATGDRWPAVVPARSLFAFAYLVVFGSLVAFSSFNYLLRTARPAVTMSYAYVNPAVAVILGALFGAESVGPGMFLAMALVTASVLMMSWSPKQKKAYVVPE